MAYRANPFLERMSERTTSDQEFVQMFAPKVLERLNEDCFEGGVHIFRSPPGGGKTTILRAFTPSALRAFWHAGQVQAETYRQMLDRGVLDVNAGPQTLGILLSCAAGYADLPPGASSINEGMFRALLDCRIVLRTLRSLAELIGSTSSGALETIRLEYSPQLDDLASIPLRTSAADMVKWAQDREREIYSRLDSIAASASGSTPIDVRFESLLWLQAVQFVHDGRAVAPKRLLMIDDIQKLRRSQRSLLIDEIVTLRPRFPVWLAGRNIAFAEEFWSQGARVGRDIHDYALEEMWGTGRSGQFIAFAQNILDRRFALQTVVPGGTFSQYLAENIPPRDLEAAYQEARGRFDVGISKAKQNIRYKEWITKATILPGVLSYDALVELYRTRIIIARDEASKQLSFDLAPLPAEEYEDRDNSSVKGAAEIFMHHEISTPYYFGMERLCAMSTNNVEELLGLAAALYEGMKAKQALRRQAEPQLLPREQEKRLREVALRKLEFVPRNHAEGTAAKRLLESVGLFCRERTFQINAPYAPGVTGVRLSVSEMAKLQRISSGTSLFANLRRVIAECVAENLLVSRESSASTAREGGTVLYLNRTLCANFGLPLQYGGWQDASVQMLAEWMEIGFQPSRSLALEVLP